ncbi:MAG: hypothetical protein EOP09_15570 [Proteobacteria bacterium]|nr:MAG: hypothetical protein EOP09_15570 [Pseudomonadota bacterium]
MGRYRIHALTLAAATLGYFYAAHSYAPHSGWDTKSGGRRLSSSNDADTLSPAQSAWILALQKNEFEKKLGAYLIAQTRKNGKETDRVSESLQSEMQDDQATAGISLARAFSLEEMRNSPDARSTLLSLGQSLPFENQAALNQASAQYFEQEFLKGSSNRTASMTDLADRTLLIQTFELSYRSKKIAQPQTAQAWLAQSLSAIKNPELKTTLQARAQDLDRAPAAAETSESED